MSERRPQTLANHAKIVPAYHVFLTAALLVRIVRALWKLVRRPDSDAVFGLLDAVAVFVIAALLRLWPLKVQDRLIRLEETLRLKDVLPPELAARATDLRRGQYVALRFAPDHELPGLVQRILDGELRSSPEIKKAIKTWRADHLRV